MISDAFYEHVKQSPFIFTERRIEAKGKGTLVVYNVVKRRQHRNSYLADNMSVRSLKKNT